MIYTLEEEVPHYSGKKKERGKSKMSKVVDQKTTNEEPKIPHYLQRYGSSKANDDDINDDDVNDDDIDDDDDDNAEGSNQNKSGEKTFTQSQVTAMLTKEKKEGRRSMLRSLGFKSEAEAKSTLGLLQQLMGKNSEDKNEPASNTEDDAETKTALQRAENAEAKLACVTAGVNKESIDDVLAIARLKVTDKKDLETVLVEMSKEAKYTSFFSGEQSSKGTGSDPGHLKDKKSTQAGSYGARLAASSVQKKDTNKSTYF